MRNKLGHVFLLALLILAVACDSNRPAVNSGSSGSSLNDPDNDVAVNVGPAQDLVTQHVLDKANRLRNNINDQVSDSFGIEFGPGERNLVYLTDANQEPQTDNFSLSEDINCAGGGSRDIIGTAVITLNADGVTGTITGTYVIQYSGCVETSFMSSATGFCSSSPNIDGEVSSTFTIDYNLSNNNTNDQVVGDTTTVNTSNAAGIDVTVDNTTSDQTYNFSYRIDSNVTGNGLNGTVEFENELYSITEVDSFTEQVSASILCP